MRLTRRIAGRRDNPPRRDAADAGDGAYTVGKAGIEQINQSVVTCFANYRNGMTILKQVLTQLLLYYTRFQDVARRVPGAAVWRRDLVSIKTIMHEIQKYSRAF